MHRLNISYKQFYVTLNEIWLFASDPNAPSTWSEPGGKQWQRSIRGRRNWDVELGPCAVIRHLCSVAFVWETKRPQADNSRSLIDRQVSCLLKSLFWQTAQTSKLHITGPLWGESHDHPIHRLHTSQVSDKIGLHRCGTVYLLIDTNCFHEWITGSARGTTNC